MSKKKPPSPRPARLARARESILEEGFQGVLFTDLSNVFYLTGFRGSDGVFLLTETDAVLLVDGRYGAQAEEQTTNCTITVYSDKRNGILQAVGAAEIRCLGFEAEAMTYDLFTQIRDGVGAIELRPLGAWVNRLRAQKDPGEIDLLRTANRIADAAMNRVLKRIQVGMAEQEIAIELEHQLRKGGAEKPSFSPLVACGVRAAQPHAKATQRKLTDGELCFVDFGCTYEGYQTDQTITFSVGEPLPKFRRIFDIVKEAHDVAIERLRPGVDGREIDAAAREVITKNGYGDCFAHGLGHGVGIQVHEYPRLSPRMPAVLEEGMVFSIEPGIYLSGEGGVRIEDVVVLLDGGPEILTTMDKGLRTL